MKTLALIVRRADHSREAFRKHYEEIHSPLAMATIMEGTTRYVKHHLREEIFGEPAFDVMSVFEYRDAQAAGALFARAQGKEGERIRVDEQSFMDTASNHFFVVTEQLVRGAPDRSQPLLLVAFVRKPLHEERDDFLARYQAEALPALLDAVEAPVWCLQNTAAPGGEARFDCVTQLHARGDLDLAGWARQLESGGQEVILTSVYEDETETPW